MTPQMLLDELKLFIEECTKDILLQVKTKPSEASTASRRAAEVHLMGLPDKEAETSRIPYILLQFINGKDEDDAESTCQVRIVVATYSEDGRVGAMDVLNLITKMRIELLKKGVIGDQFLMKKPLEYIVYPEDTKPYFMGEMMTVWEIPDIKREVQFGE